jgi:hypothetical protein
MLLRQANSESDCSKDQAASAGRWRNLPSETTQPKGSTCCLFYRPGSRHPEGLRRGSPLGFTDSESQEPGRSDRIAPLSVRSDSGTTGSRLSSGARWRGTSDSAPSRRHHFSKPHQLRSRRCALENVYEAKPIQGPLRKATLCRWICSGLLGIFELVSVLALRGSSLCVLTEYLP